MGKDIFSTTPTIYDKTELYEHKVRPLIEEIKKICQVNQLPFVCSCATSNKDGETHYENDGVLTGSNGIVLYDDRMVKFLLCLQGAKLAPIGDIRLDDASITYLDQVDSDELDADAPDELDQEEDEAAPPVNVMNSRAGDESFTNMLDENDDILPADEGFRNKGKKAQTGENSSADDFELGELDLH